MVEVQPFSHEEQMRFVQALLPEKQRSFWNLERIQQFLNSINGYPGEIRSACSGFNHSGGTLP